MTQEHAKRIEQAAIMMLHAVNETSGNASVRAALHQLPPDPELGPVSLRSAYKWLEATREWRAAATDEK